MNTSAGRCLIDLLRKGARSMPHGEVEIHDWTRPHNQDVWVAHLAMTVSLSQREVRGNPHVKLVELVKDKVLQNARSLAESVAGFDITEWIEHARNNPWNEEFRKEERQALLGYFNEMETTLHDLAAQTAKIREVFQRVTDPMHVTIRKYDEPQETERE